MIKKRQLIILIPSGTDLPKKSKAPLFEKVAKAGLKAANIDEYHKPGKKEPKERKKRDMSEYIDRVQTEVQKKYAQSVTNMTRNEFDKQRSAAIDTFTEWKTVYVDFSGNLQRAQIDNRD